MASKYGVMRAVFVCLITGFVLYSCAETADERFVRFQRNFEQSFASRQSQQKAGYILNIPGKERLFADYQYLNQQLHLLNRIDPQLLSEANRREYDSTRNVIDRARRQLTIYRNDPSVYNIGGQIKQVLARENLRLEEKLGIIGKLLERTGEYYEQARRNIYRPVPGKARIGSQKQLLTLQFLQGELQDSIASAGIAAAERDEILKLAGEARIEIKNYLAYCESLWFENQDSLQTRNGSR